MKKILIATISLSIFFVSCKENKKSNSEEEKNSSLSTVEVSEGKTESNDAVCILDKLSIRDTPGKKGKWITSMSLGEQITFLGEKVTDSVTKKDFSKVKLVDGKEGWTRSDFIVVGGKVGAMLTEATIYKRPDLLTKTDTSYSPMDIIAIMSTKDDWIQVKGKRKNGKYIEEAWIKSSNITNTAVDIATAKYAQIALSKGSMTEKIKALQKLTNNTDLSESKFIPILEEKIKDFQEKNASKDIIEKAEEVTNE